MHMRFRLDVHTQLLVPGQIFQKRRHHLFDHLVGGFAWLDVVVTRFSSPVPHFLNFQGI
jgi:hypothetical protein